MILLHKRFTIEGATVKFLNFELELRGKHFRNQKNNRNLAVLKFLNYFEKKNFFFKILKRKFFFMYPCCEKCAYPLISVREKDSIVKAVFVQYPDDFLELQGQFSLELVHGKVLLDYMRHEFHREKCVKKVEITRPIIQAILGEVIKKTFLMYLTIVDIENNVGFAAQLRSL